MGIEVGNPDKLIFPEAGYTKRDLVAHYERVGGAMLPHVDARPLTLQRFPNGVAEKGFMQKNASKHFPDFIGRVEMPKQDGTTIYPTVSTEEGIAYLANQGTVTFHAWTSKVPHLDTPDRLILDIDPETGDTASARKGATVVRDILESLHVPSAPMATGSKGYHVVSSIEPSLGVEDVGAFARAVASIAATLEPDVLTTEFSIEKRRGRAFVDWLRNRYGQTGVAPWSLRPRPDATVAVPIAWDELDEVAPDAWNLGTVEARLGVDSILGLHAVSLDGAIAAIPARLAELDITVDEGFDRFRS